MFYWKLMTSANKIGVALWLGLQYPGTRAHIWHISFFLHLAQLCNWSYWHDGNFSHSSKCQMFTSFLHCICPSFLHCPPPGAYTRALRRKKKYQSLYGFFIHWSFKTYQWTSLTLIFAIKSLSSSFFFLKLDLLKSN